MQADRRRIEAFFRPAVSCEDFFCFQAAPWLRHLAILGPPSFVIRHFFMRQRNYLLALVLLALFAASGVWYFRAFVGPKKPFGIILFVGEGLVTSRLAAARLYDGGANHRLAIDSLSHVALLSTSAADFAVPDSAAAASALACGVKVNHHALGIDPAGRRLVNLLQAAASAHGGRVLRAHGRLPPPPIPGRTTRRLRRAGNHPRERWP